ncbi:HEAT repeat domain-containing protein [Paenibacillus sp. Soil787]|uniref:HEAT repeat domain-containing protein n=1 Tax=Paenibacillus sp. Soil787 TaxID=1736411 RepID=UPI0012E3B2FD|nr:HEAT repeat domain-containing protein [Paenibacillus sp. Soil787]
MNTLYFIELFKIERMQDDLLKLLESKKCSSEERYQIYLLLADFGYVHLQELFKESKGLPPFLLNEMISLVIHTDNFESYVEIFYDLPYEWQLSMLDVLRDKNFRSLKLQELLESLLNVTDQEKRVRATKTIASLGYISSPDVITQIINEQSQKEEWGSPQFTGEKLMYARLMGNIKTERFLPYLKQFISDKSYAIRSEAAKAIRKYKNGREILLSITATHPDSYARNIANEWLERSMDYE